MSEPKVQVALEHRLSNRSAIDEPGDDLALVDNLNAILSRGAGLADVLGCVDPAGDDLWPDSRQAAGQALRLELLDARALIEAWWKSKGGRQPIATPAPLSEAPVEGRDGEC